MLRHNGSVYSALLDTGSDRVAIRPEIATEIGATLRDNGIVQGTAGTHTDIKKTSIQILPTTERFIFLCPDAAVTRLPGDRRSFDIILGRQFLKLCRLLVDARMELIVLNG
jgi:predicted aspartyl protease